MLFPAFRSLSSMKSIFSPLSTLHLPQHHLLPHSSPFAQFHPQIFTYPCHRFGFNPLPDLRWKPSAISSTSSYAAMPSKVPDRPVPESRTLFGEIHVIIGPMFAGKTTDLLRRIQVAIDSGRKVALVKSDKDNRYSLDSVVSHDGEKMSCFALSELSLLRSKIGNKDYDMLDVIGIDEAQFFEDLYDFCRDAADCDGKTVIVAGLDGDYLRKRFGAVLDVIPLADSVTKLTSRCELCGRPAFFTFRKTDERKTELIGGADSYMPVCRRHYVNGQLVVETTRFLLESRKIDCEPCSEVVSLPGF